MHKLEEVAERIRESFETRTAARESALAQARTLTRHCANAIRAIHRGDEEFSRENLEIARLLAKSLKKNLTNFPDIYYAGYTQDALKEFAEATIVYGLITDENTLPTPEELELEYGTYLKGLAEVIGELRRHILDILRSGHSEEAERFLGIMDDIFAVLTTMDYPDAITGGLRRLTDIARSLIEHTRGDLSISIRHQKLENNLLHLEEMLSREEVSSNKE